MKGHSRKGKALFDLGKLQEAKQAYRAGLEIEPDNDACKNGVANVEAHERFQKASSNSSNGSFGFGGMLGKLAERLKKGGRLPMYMVLMGGYMVYKNMMMDPKSSARQTTVHEAAVDDEDDAGSSPTGLITRSFADASGHWLSLLQSDRAPDSTLLLLHRTSLSAEAEFGHLLQATRGTGPTLSSLAGVRLVAPDRPCHGYSPCPPGGEPEDASSWLGAILRGGPSSRLPRRVQVAALGKGAARQALALLPRRPEIERVWLVQPQWLAPLPPPILSHLDARAWLENLCAGADGGTASACEGGLAAAETLRWATVAKSSGGSTGGLDVSKVPKGLKVALIYGSADIQDEALSEALAAQGAAVTTRVAGAGQDPLDLLVDDVQRVANILKAREDEQVDADEEDNWGAAREDEGHEVEV